MLKLIIGNRRFSSWSMRSWVLLRQLGLEFEAEQFPYPRQDWAAAVAAVHPAGTVPVLVADSLAVGDTLAIAETLAELFPDAGVWPADRILHARARSLCAEMHASFGAIRDECPFDVFRSGEPRPLSARGAAQLLRVDAILSAADAQEGFLCGRFCAADAFYIPLALRVLQYGLAVSAGAHAYIERIAALPAVREWIAEAGRERDWPPVAPGGIRPYHRALVCAEDALRLARHWVGCWNARRLESVLDLFSEEAVFLSPKAEILLGRARVEGKAALRAYWTTALEQIGQLEFKLDTADWDAASSTVVVIYEANLAGKRSRAAERWVLDPAGRIRYGEAYYGAAA
jgi:glutathione S-transferase